MLEEKELVLHTRLLKHEFLEELERKLRTGSPYIVAKYYKNLPKKIDLSILTDISNIIKDRQESFLSKDDLKVIDFFTNLKEGQNYKDFFNIISVLLHVLSASQELEEYRDDIPENIAVCAMLWIYLNIYEAILDIMTQKLMNYYSCHQEDDSKKKLLEINKKIEAGDHLTAGQIEKNLVDLKIIGKNNKSILSGSESRFFRNKLGHANIFYDDKVKKLILTNGKEYSLKKFQLEFDVIYQFLLEWLFSLNGKKFDIQKTVKNFITETSKNLHRDLIKIERGGLKKKFNIIIFSRAQD